MAERNCKKCFHYNACKEVASHGGYSDISYTKSQCKHFISSDVVEVVRCKDCVYRMELNPIYQYEGRALKVCFVRNKPVSDDGYCNEAIRKEGE